MPLLFTYGINRFSHDMAHIELVYCMVIILGKLPTCFRNLMLDHDGSEDFIEDIVDDLIGLSLDKCFQLYLERQLLPFTVTQAKDYILSIIEVFNT